MRLVPSLSLVLWIRLSSLILPFLVGVALVSWHSTRGIWVRHLGVYGLGFAIDTYCLVLRVLEYIVTSHFECA